MPPQRNVVRRTELFVASQQFEPFSFKVAWSARLAMQSEEANIQAPDRRKGSDPSLVGSPYDHSFYPERAFGGFSDVDGTVTFYTRVNSLIDPAFRIVDFGCGRGAHSEDAVALRRDLRSFKGRVETVIGLDVD